MDDQLTDRHTGGAQPGEIGRSATDFAFFLLGRHLDPMLRIATELGDERVNIVPALPGANSPYAVVFHSAGMLEWWAGHVILGRTVPRDRDAEFSASGTVEVLANRVAEVRVQVVRDLHDIDLDGPVLGNPSPGYLGTPIAKTAHGVLLHALEELAQHHGHLEISRDLILAMP